MVRKQILNVCLIIMLLQWLPPWQNLAASARPEDALALANGRAAFSAFKAQNFFPSTSSSEKIGPPPLPMSCIGGGTPLNYDDPVCCVSGYVHWNGAPVAGASVTVSANGSQMTTQTQVFAGSDIPYYYLSLYDEPLNVRPGQTVTVSVSLSGQNKVTTFRAQTGGQQVDVVLPQTETVYGLTTRANPGDPAPGHSAGLSYTSAGQTILMGGSKSKLNPATYRWDGSVWTTLPASAAMSASEPTSLTSGEASGLAADAGWDLACVDCPRYFQNMTDRSLRLDANEHPHVAYGDDHLYYAWRDDTTWHTEVVDNSPGVGSYAALALDGTGYAHISYFDAVNINLKYAWQDGSGWHIQTLDPTAKAGTFSSLALDSHGHAHISYYDIANTNLKYAWQDDTRWRFEIVDEIGAVGQYSSLALDSNEDTHISYYDEINHDLKYAWQDTAGWHIQTVDFTNGVGQYTSLALSNSGYAHISYFDITNTDLKYAWQDVTGWHIQRVDSDQGVGQYTSLALDRSGYAHISYFDMTRVDLKYAWQDAAGWHIQTVDSIGSIGQHTSLSLDSTGYPHITYYDAINYQKYAWKDVNGWHLEMIDAVRDRGQFSSLALDRSGYPHISYYDFAAQDLRYAWQDSDGWHIQTIASIGNVGMYNSLALDRNDYAYISYYDNTSQDLRFAWQDAVGWHFTNVDSMGDVGLYTSLALDNAGYAHISYCQGNTSLKYAWEDAAGWHLQTIASAIQANSMLVTSLALDNNGYAHISYYADWTLKYTQQNDSGWQIEQVDSNTRSSISLVLDSSGYAHISYGSSKYAWQDTAGWHFRTLSSDGTFSSLALGNNGYPHISYYDRATLDLKYTWQDATGWHTQTADSIGDVGQYNSLALDQNGNVHISYYDLTNHDLKYAYLQAAPPAPAQRYGHVLSRNTDSSTLLTFGGIQAGGVYLNDTRQLVGNQWELLPGATAPSARAYYGLTYDGQNKKWILFGGKSQSGDLDDTWIFDGTTWTQAQPLHSPPARSETTLTYDPQRQRAVLVGGRSGNTLLADVWEWDGSDWVNVTPAQPLTARAGHAAAYDSARQVVVIAAGQGTSAPLSDLWEWDGTAWEQRVSTPDLPAMVHLAMDYDPAHDQMVIVGGENGTGLVQGTFLLSPAITPSNAPPMASIFRVSPRDVRPDESISFQGRGADADASGSGSPISAYRWLLGAEVLSAAAEFTLPASRFSCGEHEIGFQVQDNEGQWSPLVQQRIFVRDSNGGTCKGKSWTLLVYAAGDNNLATDLQLMIKRVQDSGPLPNVQVGILYDGPKSNDTRRYTLTANGEWAVQTLSEARMDDMETLRDFIQWGFANFATDYYFVALADHANGAIGFAQDLSSSDPVTNPKPFLTPIEMRSALQAATGDGTRKIDVLMFDGCSFGLFENAAIAAGQAQLVIASPNTGWGEFAYERYRQLASSSDNPRVFAQNVATAYTEEVNASNPNLPYTISVFDLARFEATKAAIDNLGSRILNYVKIDPSVHASEIEAVRTSTQKYDSIGASQYETDNDDSYVDLVSLAENLIANINDTEISSAALAVKEAIQGAQPFIVYEKHASGHFQYYDPTIGQKRWFTVNLDNAHGLGIFYPPHATTLPNSAYQRYITNQLFDITDNWNWTAFLKSDLPALSDRLSSTPPLMDDALISLPVPPKKVFVPLTQR